jgi:hypothetical protein
MKGYIKLTALLLPVLTAITLMSCTVSKTYNSGLLISLAMNSVVKPPTNLTSVGSWKQIQLNWTASAGATGYNVYRSMDGITFTLLPASPVLLAPYADAIDSPAGDGIFYYYRVTAVKGSRESHFSNTVKNIHGTRLAASNASGFLTKVADSPYVAEGTVAIDGGDLQVAVGTALYVVDGATIDIQGDAQGAEYMLEIGGLMRVLASTAAPATFTSHKAGGLADNEGFKLAIDGTCTPYNTADGSGTLIQNTIINNIRGGSDAIQIYGSPRIYNSKITSNASGGGSYIYIRSGSAPIIQNCSLQKNVIVINNDFRTSANFSIDHNILRGGYYSMEFYNQANPAINTGQIALNDFDGSKHAYLIDMTGGVNVPLGNNYWTNGTNPGPPPTPQVDTGGTTSITIDFTTALSTSPIGVGPTW